MTLKLVSTDASANSDKDISVTIVQLAIAREYYRCVEVDLHLVCNINTITVCGKGYHRDVDDSDLRAKILAADSEKVRKIP